MLKIILISFGVAGVGYLVGLFGGILAVQTMSSNNHDRGVEAAMTGAFVVGPLVALIAMVASLVFLLGRAR